MALKRFAGKTVRQLKMKGRIHGTNVCQLANCLTYVQVNIYNTDIETMKKHGFDIQDWLRDTGYRSIIMDVPFLNPLSEPASEIVAKRSHDAEKNMLSKKAMVVHTVHTADSLDGLLAPKSSLKPSNAREHTSVEGARELLEEETLYEDCKVMSGEDSHIDALASSIGKTAPMDYVEEHESNRNFHHIPPLEGSSVTWDHGVNEERSGLESALAEHKADDIMSETDTSYVITELSPIAPLKTKSSEAIEENDNTSNKASPIRQDLAGVLSAASSTMHDAGNEAEMSAKVNNSARKGRWKNHPPSPFVRSFECHYPACTTKIIWRPGYGKNRLVTHVRIHWGKKVKKCRHCDYSATHWGGIYQHHQRKHPDEEFAGAIDLETEEDMRELMELWRQCYPGMQPSHRHFYCKSSTFDT